MTTLINFFVMLCETRLGASFCVHLIRYGTTFLDYFLLTSVVKHVPRKVVPYSTRNYIRKELFLQFSTIFSRPGALSETN